jgi:hypothetical protein
MKTLLILTLFACAALAATLSNAAPKGAAAKPKTDSKADAVYVAQLQPVNSKASGLKAGGEMRFTVHGDRLTIKVRVHGVPPDIEHWQHFHGFPDGRQATCPGAAADVNGDGYIDIRETEPTSGTTMVPFNADPVKLEIPTDTYPHATARGTFEYQKIVSLSALQSAFGAKFDGHAIDLDHRVVQVHGVLEMPALPASVASLGTIPARVTLPLACGEIKRIQ